MRYMSSVWLMLLFSTTAVASKPTENYKIQYLLSVIGSSEVIFIRNGAEYSPTEAQAHLQDKLKAAGDKVKTAEDFITLLASKSFQTGKVYLIKTKDGKTVESASWLREKLKEMPIL